MASYTEITESEVPAGIVFTTPARNQGQASEVSYSRGIPAGKEGVDYEAADGDPYMRERTSEGELHFWRLATPR